jgi:hypothetical protein
MSGELDAAGGLATAGLVAGAIEGSEPGKAGEGACLNCGAQLGGGRYCANCGQPAHANRSLWSLIEEILWNVFNLDTKAWRTIPRLLFRPGTLTRGYIDGKRARYLTPLATFLLCYFFMFLVFSGVQSDAPIRLSDSDAVSNVNDARDNLKDAQEALQEAQQGLAEARQDAGPHASGPQSLAVTAAERAFTLAQAEVQRRQAALERAQARQREAAQAPVTVHIDDTDTAAIRRANSTAATPAAPQSPAAPNATQNPAPPPAPGNPTLNTDNGPITLDDVLKKIATDNIDIDGKPLLNAKMRENLSNPPLFYSHLQDAASHWGFLLAPLSLPFIAFLFLFKKGITLYDHAVFSLNSLSFASLLFALILAVGKIPALHFVEGASILIALPVHTFFHVGGATGSNGGQRCGGRSSCSSSPRSC